MELLNIYTAQQEWAGFLIILSIFGAIGVAMSTFVWEPFQLPSG